MKICVKGRVFIASQFLDESLWIVAGRVDPWADENNPPVPSGNETMVEQPQFAKKATVIYQVYEGSAADYDIRLDDTYWKIAATEQVAYSNIARWAYVKFVLDKGTGPNVTVRQFGIFRNLTPTVGNEGKLLLLPAEIQDYGQLLYLHNRRKVDREPVDQGELFEYLIPF